MSLNLRDVSLEDKIGIIEAASELTVDTEGVGPMLGLSFCVQGMPEGLYLPFHHSLPGEINLPVAAQKKVLQLLGKRRLTHHNAIHDCMVLEDEGLTERYEFDDTMLMAHWVNEEMMNYSLDYVSKAYSGRPKNASAAMKQIILEAGWHGVPLEMMDFYSSNDSFITEELKWKIKEKFDAQFPAELWDIEQQFIRDVIIPMKRRGVRVDIDFITKEYFRGTQIMDALRNDLKFNPTSGKDLERVLNGDLGLPVVAHTKSCEKCYPKDKRKPKQAVSTHWGKPSFDKAAMELYEMYLEKNNDPTAQKILTYRGWQKTVSSNYKSYMRLATLEDGIYVLRPSYKLHGTRTSRLSCEDPNLQQIPKASDKPWNGGLKQAFVPRDGFGLWTVDYSQLQFRMTCAYGNITKLIDIFNDPSRDVFDEMAADMGWIRDDVKTQVYLTIFGGGVPRAAAAFGISLDAAKGVVGEFHSNYPEIKAISNDCKSFAEKSGFVQYWTGRRRHFWKGSPTHKAFNAVIQGGEAEIVKRAMIRIAQEICDENCFLILQIHDEVVLEIATGMEDHYLPRVQKVMEEVCQDFCDYVGIQLRFAAQAKAWGKK